MSSPEPRLQPERIAQLAAFHGRARGWSQAQTAIHLFAVEDIGVPADVQQLWDLPEEEIGLLVESVATGFSRVGPTDDHRRLRTVQARLLDDGIVLSLGEGETHDDANSLAVQRGLLHEAAGRTIRGMGFCSVQDVWHTMEGRELAWSYGDFEDGAAEPIGQAIAEALAAEGLGVEWSGSAQDRIVLPGFAWGPPTSVVGEPERAECLSDLNEQLAIAPEWPSLDELWEWADQWFDGWSGYQLAHVQWLHIEAADAVLRLKNEERTGWTAWTDNDRLDWAFDQLGAEGILCERSTYNTLKDAWTEFGARFADDHRGALLFHNNDALDALHGEGLRLAYVGRRDGAAVAQRAVEVLRTAGLNARWSQDPGARIEISDFVWRQRKVTSRPAGTPEVVSAGARPGFLARWLGRRPTQTPSLEGNLEGHALIARSAYDEGSTRPQLLRRARRAWHQAGQSTPAQLDRLGPSVDYLRAGSLTGVTAIAAGRNLPSELVLEWMAERAEVGRTGPWVTPDPVLR